MAIYINTLVNTAGGDLARQTRFRATFTIPSELRGDVQDRDLDLLCKNFSIPPRKMEILEYKYKGKTVPIMGPIDFQHNISVTFLLDEGHKIRTLFENWLLALDTQMNSANEKISKFKSGYDLNSEMTSTLRISALNWREDTELQKYTFSGAFPVNIGEVAYSTDSISSVQEFTVEFAFLLFKTEASDSSDLLADITGAINNGLQGDKESLSEGAQVLLDGATKSTAKSSIDGKIRNKKQIPSQDVMSGGL